MSSREILSADHFDAIQQNGSLAYPIRPSSDTIDHDQFIFG
jgi:hypothetical protein